jgi:acyl-CoA thioesterase
MLPIMRNPKQKTSEEIVDLMFNNDPFSTWLGIERISEAPGNSVLKMKVRKNMLNGFGIAHGGIAYALADSALAFASNSHGRQALSVETSISHVKKVKEGDVLKTHVKEINLTNKIGIYQVIIENQDKELVAVFKGTVYRTEKYW